MRTFIQVSTTVDKKAIADKIAKTLLDKRLAACVQILGPIYSSYRWNGKVERANEWLCIVKARTKDYRKIELAIKKNHSYKVPEVLAFLVSDGNDDYLEWVKKETTRTRRP